MKRLLLLLPILLTIITLNCFGQSPQHINYQAVLRNTETGVELSNQPVFLVVKFLDESVGGEIVYQEEHANIQTDLYGLINIKLGSGDATLGSFEEIPWESGQIMLSLEADAGNGLVPVGKTKFSSVPYALFAANANSEPDPDEDPQNEIQDLSIADHALRITNNPSATTIDLSPYISNPDDEIQDLSLSENVLTVTNNANATPIDLSPFVNQPDADSDPENELISSFTYDTSTGTLKLIEGGNIYTHDLSGLAGGDGSAIQDLSMNNHNLTITNNPTASTIDFTGYINNPSDEIQDLSLSGSTLSITNNSIATDIDLSGFVSDPNDEIQDLSLSGNTLKITNNSTASDIDLSPYVNNASDEIQDLSLSGNTLTITNNSSATPIDLSQYENPDPDGDGDSSNEIQDLSLSGNTLKITNNSTASDIDLSPYVNNASDEIQDLSLSGNTLTITNNSSATPIDLSQYENPDPDGDGDSSNEIQDLSFSGNTLTITNNSSATPIDLSQYENPDSDGDGDSSNEIQDLSLSGDNLKITNNISASTIDLSGYKNQDLPEGYIFIGNSSDVATPIAVSGDISMDTGGLLSVEALQNTPVSAESPNDGDVLTYDDSAGEWEPRGAQTKYYSVDPMDFVELTDPDNTTILNPNFLDDNNALKYHNKNAPFAMLRDNGSIEWLGAPVHLPHNSLVTKITFYVKDIGAGVLSIGFYEKKLDDFSTGNSAIAFDYTQGVSGNEALIQDIDDFQIKNNTNTYRIIAHVDDDEMDDNADIDEIQQIIYGVVIEYQE